MADRQPPWLTWVHPLCFMYFILSWLDQCHFIGTVLHSCPSQVQCSKWKTINKEYYLNVLCWLRGVIERKQPAAAIGNWWLAASSQQCAYSCITSHAEVFGETSNHFGGSAPLQPIFEVQWLMAFPKTKITFEKEGISDYWWDSGKYDGVADGNSNKGFCRVFWTVVEMLGELCEVPTWLLWRGLKYHCLMYNGSCILYLLQYVSIFHRTQQDTFCTDLIFISKIPLSFHNYNIRIEWVL